MEHPEEPRRRYGLSWILAAPLFGYAGWASLYAETHLRALLAFGVRENVALPPITMWLIGLGTDLATCIALLLAVAVPFADVLLPRRLRVITILCILASVLFSSFVALAVWSPVHRFAHQF